MFLTEIIISGITDRDVANEISKELNNLLGIPVLVTLPHRDFEINSDYFLFDNNDTDTACFKVMTEQKVDCELIDKLIFKLKLAYDNVEVKSFGVQTSASSFVTDFSSLDLAHSPKKP